MKKSYYNMGQMFNQLSVLKFFHSLMKRKFFPLFRGKYPAACDSVDRIINRKTERSMV